MNLMQMLGLLFVGLIIAATANRNRIGFANKPRKTSRTCTTCGAEFDTVSEFMSHECNE
jgi:hypothetical protein